MKVTSYVEFNGLLVIINWRPDDKTTSSTLLFPFYTKQQDSRLQCVCSVIDHSLVRTPVTHSTLVCSYHSFDVSCDLLLNRRTATLNLFVTVTKKRITRENMKRF